MANTTKIKTAIEPHVRNCLSKQFPGHVFKEKPIQLTTGGSYTFDAVAENASIVAAILSNRAKTRTGRENTGGVRKALLEIGYLKAVPESVKKVMVFTDDDFYQLIRRRASRLGTGPIQMMLCKLPPHLEAVLREILDKASHEQRAAE
ncbi:MAG: hypothetical protein ISS54_06190 [Dehalococcoidia bacterium]|nr:hypothetical protein [Dehalococcoidia bacterium]